MGCTVPVGGVDVALTGSSDMVFQLQRELGGNERLDIRSANVERIGSGDEAGLLVLLVVS